MRPAFARLAAAARDAGTRMVLEPIAFSHVSSLAMALDIIDDNLGHGGGVMLDSFHANRGVATLDEIAALPAGAIGGAELDDGPAVANGPLLDDTLNRSLCGEGEFDLPAFIRAVRAGGYLGAFGVEIISPEQRARSLDDAARRSFDTARAQFGQSQTGAPDRIRVEPNRARR